MVSNLTLRPRKLTRGAGYDPLELGLLSEKQSIQGTMAHSSRLQNCFEAKNEPMNLGIINILIM